MKLRHLIIKNFRGIRDLDWTLTSDFVCLIGPGDSTKTTILNAIEYVFSPRWNLSINDLDFYQSETKNPIEIIATITDFPEKLKQEDKYGLCLSFWNDLDKDHYEDKDSDLISLIINFYVDDSLEPQWFVRFPQTGEKKMISSSDRELLMVTQIGAYIERDLSWGRTSALTRFTGKENIEEIPAILTEASRTVREALHVADFKRLDLSVKEVEASAQSLGVQAKTRFRPGVDPTGFNLNMGAITLLDGDVPLRSGGLGSRRLLVMAINKGLAKKGSITLIDEIESGLEPFRLRNLIRTLRQTVNETGQCIITTHSAISIVEHLAKEIFVVHSDDGKTVVKQVSDSHQATIRSIPEALLARCLIVCEGKTEWGFCRAAEEFWESHGKSPLACMGVEPIYSKSGGGSEAPSLACHLADLGYRVAYFGDSDTVLSPSVDSMEGKGIKVILWGGNVNIEQRMCLDLPFTTIGELVGLAIQINNDAESVWRGIFKELRIDSGTQVCSIEQLLQIKSETDIRRAVGSAASNGQWFKQPEKGKRLGRLVFQYFSDLTTTDTGSKISDLYEWCYA